MAYPYSAPADNKADATPTITDHPAHHNALADALIDLLAELGTGPKGGSADLTARLAALDTTVAGKQPLDADLTSLAAGGATATTWLRALLDAVYDATGAAAAAQAASQPLDADLTAIAALVTTAYGRGLLTDADAAAFTSRLTGLLNATYVSIAGASEIIDDRVATLLVAGTNVALVYDDTAGTITISSTDTTLTTEQVQDIVGALLADTGVIDVTYDDAGNVETITIVAGSVTNAMLAGSIDQAKVTNLTTDLAAKAPLASPALTGNPTAPTQSAADNSTKIATTAYTDAAVGAVIAAADAMVFKGVIDASANPNYPAADRGHTYRISVAGKIGGASGVNVEVGDLLLALTDGTAAGNQATVGSSWTIVQSNLDGAVIGPASVTDGVLALFDGTTGKLIKAGVDPSTLAPKASPALTGSPTAPTQSAADNSTKIATTAYADAKVADAIADAVTGVAPSQNAVFDALALKAPLASPALTGTPTVPDDPYDATTWNGSSGIPTKNAVRDKIESLSSGAADGTGGIYGDGSDGNVTITGTTTLARDMFYDTLTVQNGGILNTANFRVYCKTLCQIDTGGLVRNLGVDAPAGGAKASALGAQTLGTGANGGDSQTTAGSPGSNITAASLGGDGGAGGTGASGAGGVAGTITAPTADKGSVRMAPASILGAFLSAVAGTGLGTTTQAARGGGGGGGGGGDGAVGGGGGSGAGVLVLAAKALTLNGIIRAKGGAGRAATAGNRGGGGGGGGGLILLTYNTKTGSGSTDVSGGTGGAGNGTGTAGSAGAVGTVIEVVAA